MILALLPSSHALAETLDAAALQILLLLTRVDGVTVAADFHRLILHRARDFEHHVARQTFCLRLWEHHRVDSCFHSLRILQI